MNLVERVCPECEGMGLAVDYFNLPKPDPYGFNPYPILDWLIDPRPTRMDGRYYTNSVCKQCHGGKTQMFLVTPMGRLVLFG